MLKNLPLRGFVYTSFIINGVTTVVILIAQNWLPPVVPLLYGKPVGAGELVPSLLLLLAPAVSLIITGANILLASRLTDVFLKKILSVSSLLISLLLAITVVKIILLVSFF